MANGGWVRVAAVALVAVTAGAAVLLLSNGDDSGSAERVEGEWTELAPAPLTQVEMASARVGDHIYGAGGLVPPGEATSQVARYDISEDSWELIEPMPTAVHHPGAAAAGRMLYVHGGYTLGTTEDTEGSELSVFDPGAGRWSELTPSPLRQAAHTLAEAGGRLYAIGGVRDGAQRRTVQIYDIATGRWSEGPPMPDPAREHLGSAVIGDRIYVLGGRAAGDPPFNFDLVDVLDVSTGEWTRGGPMPAERSGFEADAVDGRIVVAGGEEVVEGGDVIGEAELYDPEADAWTSLPPLPTPRHGMGLASKGRKVYVFEGGPEQGLAFSNVMESLRIPRSVLSSP
jgi:hypothetical protein